ncbi:hypothetical protein G0Q06_10525 [Puniceicoccales bacterium CK1056]|uniref:Uncharacterized protein n=1 Tax=Oceanipulchritudo coccoides TaxID=2706888 RepID=A0A6B2M3A2_9BACT|nr:hypothetical protein [Oceanipulchritudo coccoides]NDV62886.1 hypothetical protein [Oceanipulchritudo coccoides]
MIIRGIAVVLAFLFAGSFFLPVLEDMTGARCAALSAGFLFDRDPRFLPFELILFLVFIGSYNATSLFTVMLLAWLLICPDRTRFAWLRWVYIPFVPYVGAIFVLAANDMLFHPGLGLDDLGVGYYLWSVSVIGVCVLAWLPRHMRLDRLKESAQGEVP